METNEQLRRKPVWLALSEFFLDTELDVRDFQRISKTVVNSGYSIEETEIILRNEVFPALVFNLHDMAGEWDGFAEDWLVERIEKKSNPNLIQRLYYKTKFWMVRRN